MRIVLVLALVVLVSVPALGQRRTAPTGPLASVRAYQCTFSNYAVAAWDATSPRVVPGEEDFSFRIADIDLRRSAARIVGASASAEATAMLTETGLNVIEQTPAGNFILTTIFVGGGSADRYLAVHSRHLGDLSTPPSASQYYGTCEVVSGNS
jgi:hypothetical protein